MYIPIQCVSNRGTIKRRGHIRTDEEEEQLQFHVGQKRSDMHQDVKRSRHERRKLAKHRIVSHRVVRRESGSATVVSASRVVAKETRKSWRVES